MANNSDHKKDTGLILNWFLGIVSRVGPNEVLWGVCSSAINYTETKANKFSRNRYPTFVPNFFNSNTLSIVFCT